MDQITVMNRLGRGGCVVAAMAIGLPAFGQTAYFSLQGEFLNVGDQYDFNFNLSRTVDNTEDVRFTTYASNGGTNSAFDTVGSGGIDSVLDLTDSTLFQHGFNDDTVGLDSRIGWTQATGIALNPNPLPIESYRLNMFEFNNDAIGAWAVDLVAPADAITLTGVTPTGSATATSLKFGTVAGTDAATFNQVATLNLTGPMVVAQTGKAVFTNTGSTTVGGQIDVKVGGILNANAGTFNANSSVNLNGGTLNANFANFTLASGKTLAASNNAQVNTSSNFFLNGGRIVHLSGGADMTHTSQLSVGALSTGTLTVTGPGSTLTQTGSLLISQQGGTGSLSVTDNASMDVNGFLTISGFLAGAGTDGTLDVLTGGDVTADTIRIGYNDGDQGTGTLTVDGTGSTVVQSGASTLTVGNADTPGNNGSHTLHVQNGGIFTTGTGAITINKTGTVNLTSSGTLNANGNITVDGGTFNPNGITFNLAAGKNLTASNNGQVALTDEYAIGNGSTFTIQSGADLSSDSFIDIGNNTNGTLVVDGAGSTATIPISSYWGSDGGTAEVTLRDLATVTLNGTTLQVGRSSTANTHATVNIQSGAELTANNIYIGIGGSAGGTAVLTVDGSDSTVTQNGSSTLNLGHASTGTATINVQNDGVFTTGTGLTTINKTGTLNVSSFYGFTAKGNVNLAGGTLDVENSGGLDNRFNLAAGKTLTATQQAQIDVFSSYAIANGVTFNINDGSDFRSASLEVGIGSTGTMNIDGMGSTLTLTEPHPGQLPAVGGYGGTGTLTIRNKANVTIDDELLIATGGHTNTNGTVNVQSGATLNTDHIRIITLNGQGTGTLTIDGAGSVLTQNGASVLDIGQVGAGGDGIVTISNNGTLNAGTGAVTVNAHGKVNLAGGTLNATTINHTRGGIFNFYDGRLSVDTFDGYLDQQGGTLAPGNSPGITTITNGYFNNGGTIEVEMGGLTAGADFDQIQITGNAHLGAGSVLDVLFPNAFTYMQGDSMVILQASSITGAFSSVDFATNPGAALGLIYNATTVTLLAGLPGDLNNDGFVGIDDLNIVLGNWNQNVTAGVWAGGDPSGDGFIGIDDLNTVLGNWNAGTPPPPISIAGNIPEPASLMLLATGFVGVSYRRR